MKKINLALKTISVATILLNVQLFAADNNFLGDSYVSVGYIQSSMKMDKDYGGNVFAKSAPGVNLSFGKMFNEYFGVEVGYEFLKNKTNIARIYYPDQVFGRTVGLAAGNYDVYKTNLKLTAPYAGLNAKLPFADFGFVQLLVGAALVKIKANSVVIADIGNPNLYSIRDAYIDHNVNKILPTVKLNIGKNIADNFAVKASYSWINTQRIKGDTAKFIPKLKNATNFGLGLVYYL